MYAIKLELKLNNCERTLMKRHAGYARFCYNMVRTLYLGVMDIKVSRTRKLGLIKKTFTNFIKKQPEYQWTNTLSSRVYQNAFIAFNRGLERFVKGGSGFPNFKRKKSGDSFTVDSSNGPIFLSAGNRIKIPTLGTFRLKEAIGYNCCSQTFTISRTADKWYVSFTVKADKIPPLYHFVCEPTGIDLGVSTFATLSDGTVYQLPGSLKKAKIKLGKLQYRNRNKQLGNKKLGTKKSKNAQKFERNFGKQHANIASRRRDFLQKTTTEISKKYAHIRIEDLNISGMAANHKLAEAVLGSGFYEFRRELVYKSPIYGTVVEVVDRWYPSSKTCSNCDHVQPMPLKERVFVCEACGNSCNRDLNAAINLASVSRDRVRMASPELTPVE
ncbi:RNA-guided endonuclease TnpB family protein [Tychonema sp. LEGE 07203]|uniref:RNA-guided endonuclease InsQ/TnpB family protein n=1 Tax=Tychonema sp. LEGE 07203 TaxID=1828671 RepID=UPI0018827B57|nr:RNA-guided endonuclease TnpB family protein [Tychonema sp. LEGE 07203]MBE9094565.1 transposase [Tychonema sp. LEGE 07203]